METVKHPFCQLVQRPILCAYFQIVNLVYKILLEGEHNDKQAPNLVGITVEFSYFVWFLS